MKKLLVVAVLLLALIVPAASSSANIPPPKPKHKTVQRSNVGDAVCWAMGLPPTSWRCHLIKLWLSGKGPR